MNAETVIATGLFAVSMIVVVLFLLVWFLQALASLRQDLRLRRGMSRRAFEQESHARGLTLLRGWLSPVQLQCYNTHGYFDVAGCDSNRIYRIHQGTQANVEQLDGFGAPVCAWCFVPEGDLVAGDVMLAQKIALETSERAALAVAVRHATLRQDFVLRSRWFSPGA